MAGDFVQCLLKCCLMGLVLVWGVECPGCCIAFASCCSAVVFTFNHFVRSSAFAVFCCFSSILAMHSLTPFPV
ncbi:hypothetical protein HDV63DRAFT_385966 [Trichoderma sp. SZMC 28014]